MCTPGFVPSGWSPWRTLATRRAACTCALCTVPIRDLAWGRRHSRIPRHGLRACRCWGCDRPSAVTAYRASIPPYVRAEDLRCIPGVLRVVAHPTERSGSRRLVIRASEVEDGPEGEIGFTADALVFLALGLSQPHWNGREFLDPDVMVWSSAGKERAEAAIATKCGGGPACRADFMRVLALKFSPRLGGARGATATVAATPSATALTGGDIAAKVDECGTVVWGEVTETSDELVQRFLGHMRGDRDELTVAYSVCAV